MKIEQFRTSSLERTVLFPFLSEYLGPRTTEAGFQNLAEQQSIEQHPHRRQMPSDGGLGNELLQFLREPMHYSERTRFHRSAGDRELIRQFSEPGESPHSFGLLTLSLRTRGRTDRETINRRNRSTVPRCPRPCKNLESVVAL
jgi:hypothetical protein